MTLNYVTYDVFQFIQYTPFELYPGTLFLSYSLERKACAACGTIVPLAVVLGLTSHPQVLVC